MTEVARQVVANVTYILKYEYILDYLVQIVLYNDWTI